VNNPFIGYGEMVNGARFVGRQEAIRAVLAAVTAPAKGSSIAIIGGPKVGKSSLLWQTLMEDEAALHRQRVLPVWVNVATRPSGVELLVGLVSKALAGLESAGVLDDALARAAAAVRSEVPFWSILFDNVESFFVSAKRLGWRIVFVLDEFDAARYLYKDPAVLQALREFVNNPKASFVVAIASRRPLADIEAKAGGGSNFSEVVHKYWMPRFAHEEVDELLGWLQRVGISPTEEIHTLAERMCGGHPFLLNRLSYELAEYGVRGQSVNFEEVSSWAGVGNAFQDHYAELARFLSDVDLFNKLLETVFGPQITATKVDADRLQSYQLITRSGDGHYTPFSEHFLWHLRLQARTIEFWPLWSDTERGIRALLSERLSAKYGDDWPVRVAREKPAIATILDGCRERQEQEQRAGGSQAAASLLEFTNPAELWPLLKANWELVRDILAKDHGYWGSRFDTIPPVRRAMAHNRDPVSQADRLRAEAACRDILTALGRSGRSPAAPDTSPSPSGGLS
jgi:hypothetical protein